MFLRTCFVAILKLTRRFDVTGLHYQVKRNKICMVYKYKKNNYHSSLRKRKVTYKNMLQVRHVKVFCTDGVTLGVKARPQFFNELVSFYKWGSQIFRATTWKNWSSLRRFLSPWASKKTLTFTDSWILVFSNALMKVSGCVANIICITQITCKFVNNAMLTYNTLLNFFWLKILLQLFCSQK